MLIRWTRKRTILVCVRGTIQNWLERNRTSTQCWKYFFERRWFGRTDLIPWPCLFGMHSKTIWNKRRYCIVDNYRDMFESKIFAGAAEKLPYSEKCGTNVSSWSYDVEGHAKNFGERYFELANKTTQQLYKVATPCLDDHQFKEEEVGSVGELSKVCSHIFLKCLNLARIGGPDILLSVNKLARAITKWTKAFDKRSARLISYVHRTCEYKQYCYVGNTAKQCRLGLFQDTDFAGDLEDSKSTSGGVLCIFGSRTFVPISWMCKKQTSVSHSSTEAEIISLDAGLRMDGIPVLDLWDLGIEAFHSSSKDQVRGNSSRNTTWNKHTQNQTKIPTQHDNFDLSMLIMFRRTRSLLDLVRCCTFLRTTKQWLKWSSKAEVQQWDVYPEPTKLLLIGCLTE